MKKAIGTTLFVLGLAIVLANLPDTLRYVLQENSGLDNSLFSEYLFVGAIFVAGGWFLRRSGMRQ